VTRGIAAAVAASALALSIAAAAAADSPTARPALDRAALQETLLISRALDGGVPNGPSSHGVISGDRRWARWIAFQSEASDLVPNDVNGVSDVFAVKRTGRYTNVGPGAGQPWRPGQNILLSRGMGGQPANGPSYAPAIDGAFRANPKCVAFLSAASNLVPGDANGRVDAFVSRLPGRSPKRVMLPGGRESLEDTTHVAVSGDCSRVAIVTGGKLYVKGRRTRLLRTRGAAADPSFSTGLRNDLVFGADAGVYLSRNGRKRPRLVGPGGRNPGYNDIKRQVVTYEKAIDGRLQIVARDLGKRERVVSRRGGSVGNNDSSNPVIGNSGYYISFESDANNLGLNSLGRAGDGNGESDVYLYTDVRDITLVQSVEEKAVPLPGGGFNPSMSFYANYVLFDSPAPLGRANGEHQVFMRYLGPL
jgi:TolB protein